ncbi:DNA-directed RNA polymerase subunit beta [Brevibacillus laterosporus]|uniref:DNA-directed RNA polymerase subunit beta n=1 Tax=Brevibacillus laterosporus TaxID=1465 RepID=A0A502IKS2_BRELA|nr:DNA-directed RNA polymerase subunit beta [Brevibacillus laterosporus]QDX91612.1 DNA-directed RNA polymerase subunit beta [Brevibacillus laterosporus]RAP29633.1 hypothetical protein C2W64_03283 [Brevibacillus laterosporus]TPG69982.1 DNA-directed RNA polymerase subunit beta [Brevibacillus laterosporus]TPG85830.1 DNA-directed RNA polymerase subunit beta [Brevibacillus laterosporus]
MNQVKGRKAQREELDAKEVRPKNGRSFPKMLAKVTMVPILLFISLVMGLAIGFSVVGKMPLSQAFQYETYKHIYDLMFAA